LFIFQQVKDLFLHSDEVFVLFT